MDTEQYFNKTEEQQFEEAKSWFTCNACGGERSIWLEFLEKP